MTMDSTKSEKPGAMKSSDQHYQFIYHIFIHSVIALTCLFLCSCPLWFNSLSNSFSYFVFISVPQFWSSFLSPKCLFIVVNVIVFFLVGESKLHSSNSSSPRGSSTTSDVIYSEYVERSQSLRRCRVVDEEINKEEISKLMEIKLNDEIENISVVIELNKEVIGVVEPHKEENNKQEEEGEEIDRDQEEYCGLPAEELNKRAEEFIAKINKQRCLEARASFGVCVK